MLRKITIGLTFLLSTFSIASHASSANSPIDVKVPCFNGGFTFGLAGLYLRPSVNALDYGFVSSPETPNAGSGLLNGSFKSVDTSYDWGYRVNVGYLFPHSGNDITLAYSHFTCEDNSHFDLGANQVFLGTTTPVTFTEREFDKFNSDANAAFEFQAVDVDFGQHMHVGCDTHFRFLGGARLARIENIFSTTYHENVHLLPETTTLISLNTRQESRFEGMGPHIGVETQYALGHNFSIAGQAASAVLVGHVNTKFSEHDKAQSGSSTYFDREVVSASSRNSRVVPNLSAKIGVNYYHQFCNSTHTQLMVEAGYQVDHFYNVLDRINQTTVTNNSPITSIDASFIGPYIGIQVKA